MDGAKGSALEWALALLHAPGERFALRHKPLPAGVEQLLGIAAGAAFNDVSEAARTFNESEARLREAAQFYAREVLFFPQADAYRVLGVGADSNVAQIKAHHRLLQHWLHPDRQHDEDDAIFATRVNVAWNRLRTPERRQAYDDMLRAEPPPEAPGDVGELRGMRTWIPDTEVPRNRWQYRLPMLALSASCILLVVLVVRDMAHGQKDWELASGEAAGNASGEASAIGRAEISVPRDPAPIASVATVRRADDGFAGTQVVSKMPRLVAPPEPGASPIGPAAFALQTASKAEPTPRDARLPVQPPAPVLLASAAAPVPTPVLPANEVLRRVQGVQEQDATPPRAVQPVSQPVSQPADSYADVARAQVSPGYARIQQAWTAGDQLLHFMAAVGRPPPLIWNSPAIQSSADRLRQDLHDGGSVKLSGPQWRIGNESAVLTSGYIVQGNASGSGRFTADLIWRENHWLVTGLSIERTQ